ncbi:MAG: helix-turn-helix transcriptional regulator [Finegoldia magna]|uniref:helix-turn-helix domain-containing protein n=1 Tax=Finegoldia magna TaxID=1260 RepID=UPI0029066FEF|nr:helix-turn-helix transcriptional regulator [Finegoldia magna]
MLQKRLGEKIKEYRLSLGISQEKFALKIDMDRTYYASVESGKRNISIVNLKKIADGFNISLSELLKDL